MIDKLLGRASLKSRIEELEEEKHHLQRQLESEEERQAEAVSARQQAEEEVNRLEDRITELEDRVERLQGEEIQLEFRGTADIRGGRLDEVLSRLRSLDTEPEGALTTMVEADGLPRIVRDTFDEHAALVRRAAPCVVYTDDAGLVSVALNPPLMPDPFVEWGDTFRVEESWFRPTGQLTFALVRSDLFALGEYAGTERETLEGFESDVMGTHSKGGFSQARFERRREEQIDEHLDRCHDEIRDHASESDTVIVVGERTVLGAFEDIADYTAPVDATGEPEEALEEAFRSFWTTTLYRI